MRIALINENSQAAKNEIIFNTLNKVATKYGHVVDNYGMLNAEDKPLTYVQNGLLAAILINSGAADFIVTGCGTGAGAMLALNSFPKMLCGLVVEPLRSHNKLRRFISYGELQQGCRTAHLISYTHHRSLAFRMHQYFCLRMFSL